MILSRMAMRRAGRREEPGPVEVFLVSEPVSFVTSEVIFINGGELL